MVVLSSATQQRTVPNPNLGGDSDRTHRWMRAWSRTLRRAARIALAASVLLPALPAAADVPTRPLVGPFRFINAFGGHCLMQDYTGGVSHPDVFAGLCTGSAEQKWYTDPQPDGTLKFVNLASRACLDQDYVGGQPANIARIWMCVTPSPTQLWHSVSRSDGSYNFRNAVSGQCVAQEILNLNPRRTVLLVPCNEALAQRWITNRA